MGAKTSEQKPPQNENNTHTKLSKETKINKKTKY